MDSKMFGEIALQLLNQSQVSGSDLDVALMFRRIANDLSSNKLILHELDFDDDKTEAPKGINL